MEEVSCRVSSRFPGVSLAAADSGEPCFVCLMGGREALRGCPREGRALCLLPTLTLPVSLSAVVHVSALLGSKALCISPVAFRRQRSAYRLSRKPSHLIQSLLNLIL